MQDAYPFFIVISALCLLMGVVFLTGSKKSRYFAISAACVISQPVLSVSGMLLKSEKLLVASLFLPISLFLTVSAIEILTRYRKCSFLVSRNMYPLKPFFRTEAEAIMHLASAINIRASDILATAFCCTQKES